MLEKIIIAGFGGQGIMVAGKLLLRAGMEKGLNATYIPSYGAEVRGGTAHCQVVLSRERIASPHIVQPDCALVLNPPSQVKFAARLTPGGYLIANSTLVHDPLERKDVHLIEVPAGDLATELGSLRATNMVMLGAFLAVSDLLDLGDAVNVLPRAFPPRHLDLLEVNRRALERGYESIG